MSDSLPHCQIPLSAFAFFFDLDGTLCEIVAKPEAARIEVKTLQTLRTTFSGAEGAVAVVSGRSISDLDRILNPLRLPLAGVHGMQRRRADGGIETGSVEPGLQDWLQATVRDFIAARPGLQVEAKPGSVAIHFRGRPELEAECLIFADDLANRDRRVHPVAGKKVIDLKLGRRDKGDAIADFMAEAPFIGRIPFFCGDDVTDEAGFAVVNAMGGVSAKVGEGPTRARFRFPGTAAFLEWLHRLAAARAADVPAGWPEHSAPRGH